MRTVYERKAFVKFFERIVYFSDLYNQEGSFFWMRDGYMFLGFFASMALVVYISLLSLFFHYHCYLYYVNFRTVGFRSSIYFYYRHRCYHRLPRQYYHHCRSWLMFVVIVACGQCGIM